MAHNEEDELEFKRRVKESLAGDSTFTNEIFEGLDLSSPQQSGGSQLFGDLSGLSPEQTSQVFRDPREEFRDNTASKAPSGPQFRKEAFSSLVPTELDGIFVDADAPPSVDRPFNRQILADAAGGNITTQVQSMLSSSNPEVRQLAVDVITKGRKVLDDMAKAQAKGAKDSLSERKFAATKEHRKTVEAGKETRSTRSIEARKEAAKKVARVVQANPARVKDIKERLKNLEAEGVSEEELSTFAKRNGFEIIKMDESFIRELDRKVLSLIPEFLIPGTDFIVAPLQTKAAEQALGGKETTKAKAPTFADIDRAMKASKGSRKKALEKLEKEGFDLNAEITK